MAATSTTDLRLWRYTREVIRVSTWPIASATSSIGAPRNDSSEANEWRRAFGFQ